MRRVSFMQSPSHNEGEQAFQDQTYDNMSIDLTNDVKNKPNRVRSSLRLVDKFVAQRRVTMRTHTLQLQYRDRLRSQKQYKYCVILPDDPWKLKWDLFISILIIWTCIGSPLSLAFTQNDQNLGWLIADSITDFCFLIDIIFTFRSAYFNDVELLVDSMKEIHCHYLKFWFWVDVIAILPIGTILNRTSNPNSLIRITRISRFYRMLKMIKLLRMMRLMKNRRQYARYIRSTLRISIGLERLFIFAILSLLLCHMSSCIWYFIAQSGSGLYQDSWVVRSGYQNSSDDRIYLAGVYFTITTITTVGYGDLSAGNPQEEVYCLCLMIIGVVAYSFAIGSLTGIIQSMDSRASKIRQKIDMLSNMRSEYNINFGLYWRLRRSLYYQEMDEIEEREKFMSDLPNSLKTELREAIYKQVVGKIEFFQNRSKYFIAAVAPKLKTVTINQNNCFFRVNSPIDGIYFLSQGQATYVEKLSMDEIEIGAIHQRGSFFGHLDFFRSPDDPESLVPRRSFTVKAKKDCIALFLSKSELFNIAEEFIPLISELFINSQEDLQILLEMRDKALDEYYGRHPEIERPKRSTQKLIKRTERERGEQHHYTEMIKGKVNSKGGVLRDSSLFMHKNESRKEDQEDVPDQQTEGRPEAQLMTKLSEVLQELKAVRKEVAEIKAEMGLKSIDEGEVHKIN